MKFRLLLIPIIFVCVLALFLFSGRYVYLTDADIMIVASQEGNPALILEDGVYFVRYWNLAPGCYKLNRIDILDYNYASQTSAGRCPVQAATGH